MVTRPFEPDEPLRRAEPEEQRPTPLQPPKLPGLRLARGFFRGAGGQERDLENLRKSSFDKKGRFDQSAFRRAMERWGPQTISALFNLTPEQRRLLLRDFVLDSHGDLERIEDFIGRSVPRARPIPQLTPEQGPAQDNLAISFETAQELSRYGTAASSPQTLLYTNVEPKPERERRSFLTGAFGTGKSPATDFFGGLAEGVVNPPLAVGEEVFDIDLPRLDLDTGLAGEIAQAFTQPFFRSEEELETGISPEEALFGLTFIEVKVLTSALRAVGQQMGPKTVELIRRSSRKLQGPKGTLVAAREAVAQNPTVQKLTASLGRSIRRKQTALEAERTEERGRRIVKATADFEKGGGEAGFKKAMGRFSGPLSEKGFAFPEGVTFSQAERDMLFNVVQKSPFIDSFQRLSAGDALTGLFTGRIPARHEVVLLERLFGPEMGKALTGLRANPERVKDFLLDVVNVPRSVMTSFDLSAPFRQGILLGPRHPKEFVQNFGQMFKAFLSEEATLAKDQAIRAHPLFNQAAEAGLFRATTGGGRIARITQGEEVFISSIAEKIPFGVGDVIKRSQRAYTTFLNGLRHDTFYKVAGDWARSGNVKPEELKRLATFINAATGRGGLGALEKFAPELNFVFFSPRLLTSRIQAPALLVTPGGGARARMEIARTLVSAVATGIGMTSLLNLTPGVDIEIDPRSSDFGKAKIGKLRLDYWAGFQPIARYVAQLLTGQRKELGTGAIRDIDPARTVWNFVRSKFSPQASIPVDLLMKSTFIGESTDPADIDATTGRILERSLVPLLMQDIREAVLEEGIKGGLLVGPTVLFGFGATTFEAHSEVRERKARELTANRSPEEGGPVGYEDADTETRRLVNNDPEVQRSRADLNVSKATQLTDASKANRNTRALSLFRRLDEGLASGEAETAREFRTLYYDIVAQHANTSSDINEAFGRFQDDPDPEEAVNENDRALFEYWLLFRRTTDENIRPDVTGVMRPGEETLDFDAFEESLTRLELTWTSEQRAYVNNNRGTKDLPPELKPFEDLRKKLRSIGWFTHYEETPIYKRLSPKLQRLYRESRVAAREGSGGIFQWAERTAKAEGKSIEFWQRFVSGMDGKVNESRRELQRLDPELDLALFRFYGTAPATVGTQVKVWKDLKEQGLSDLAILQRVILGSAGSRASRRVIGRLPGVAITTLEQLAEATVAQLEAVDGVSAKMARAFIAQAKAIQSRL